MGIREMLDAVVRRIKRLKEIMSLLQSQIELLLQDWNKMMFEWQKYI
jgi:hypothetical protein